MNSATKSAHELALQFARMLHRAIGAELVHEVDRRNAASKNDGTCASHDFCDANMVMEQAYLDLFGRSSLDDDDVGRALWNEAWAHAVRSGFAQLAALGAARLA